MPARTRSRNSGFLSGSIVREAKPGMGGVPATFPRSRATLAMLRESCIDTHGSPNTDNVFDLTRTRCDVQPITGMSENAIYKFTVIGSPVPTAFVSSDGPSYNSTYPASLSISALATRLAARTTPSRPTVDLPVSLLELRDIPRMIKEAGDAIHWVKNNWGPIPSPQAMASANLAYQFGWAPLLSDIRKLLNFQEAFERKRKELTQLYNKGGLRRNVTLDSGYDVRTISSAFTYEGPITPINITGIATQSRSYKAWGSIRWTPLVVPVGFYRPTDLEVQRAAFGLDITLSTVWEALPWSWLIDWFSSTGDFLMAHRTTVPATFSRMCIMQYWKTQSVYKGDTVTNGFVWPGAVTTYERKLRTPTSSTTVTGYIPWLGLSQVSILGSLLINRARRQGSLL